MRLFGTMRVNERSHLEIGGCDAIELAKEFGTPVYVIDESLVREKCRKYRQAFAEHYPNSEVVYAGKALLTTAICRIMDEEGLSLDVVSGGELYTALKADFPAERIYFHGNNKSPAEIREGVEAGVGRFIVDSLYELELLQTTAESLGRTVNIYLRITPGVEAHTHTYIRTGQRDSKFGFDITGGVAMTAVRRALELPRIRLRGFHCHIGSQIFDVESFRVATEVMFEFMAAVRDETGFVAEELDMGGGMGIRYTEKDTPVEPEAYVSLLAQAVETEAKRYNLPKPRILIEPGRSIVGEAGVTLYTIGAIKEVPGIRTYAAVDGGMTDNPRVALYEAEYEAVVANKMGAAKDNVVSIAGKCCESGDMLIWDLAVPTVEPGDILAVFSTGAYNFSMASHYNRIPRPPVVLVKEGQADLIVRRETYDDLIACDIIPERLARGAVGAKAPK